MDNILYIPEINPVAFYERGVTNIDKYFTKHFEKYMFHERLYDWQSRKEYVQVWQTTDIIRLQFESTFDPIVASLLDSDGNAVITQPALIGIPHRILTDTYSFNLEMSLAGLLSGCYTLSLTVGNGLGEKILDSVPMFISDTPIPNTICFEYWHSAKFHKDVIWASGIKMQYRVHGHFGFLDKARTDVSYRDQRWNPSLLSAKTSKLFPLYVGNEYGIPDDHYNLIDHIWGVDNVLIDGKPFGISEGQKVEVIDIGFEYPKRGFKYIIEEGINRSSRIYAVDTDTTKKIVAQVFVESKVFGDLANQGSSNAVPTIHVE